MVMTTFFNGCVRINHQNLCTSDEDVSILPAAATLLFWAKQKRKASSIVTWRCCYIYLSSFFPFQTLIFIQKFNQQNARNVNFLLLWIVQFEWLRCFYQGFPQRQLFPYPRVPFCLDPEESRSNGSADTFWWPDEGMKTCFLFTDGSE